MTAKEFNSLSLDGKGVVFQEGTYVDQRIVYNEHKIVMYSLHNFYVEIYYNAHSNKIEDIDALESLDDWDNFMASVKLGDLI